MVVILFNIGATPTIDSLLFFIQAIYLLLKGRSDYENFRFLAFFNPNFTFDLCITPSLDILSKLILQYVTPVYILFLMAAILMLTYFKRISRLLGRHSILQGLWLLFLISYFNIAMATFDLMYCGRVGPVETNGESNARKLVLIQDASVECYKGLHLFFAIIAFAISIFFVVPLPFYVLGMMRITKLKPISDVYCSCYKDDHRWWIFVSLARRLILVMVGVFIQDYVNRHFGLLVAIIFILLVMMTASPYKNGVDNSFSLFVVWMLALTAVVTQPVVYLTGDPRRGFSLFLVVVTILSGLALVVLEAYLQRVQKKTVGEFYRKIVRPRLSRSKKQLKNLRSNFSRKSHLNQHELEESTRSTTSTFVTKQNVVDASSYREPLLDSQFYSSDELERGGTWSGNGPSVSSISINGSLRGSTEGEKEKSFFSRKKFEREPPISEEEGPATAPTVTEVSTGGTDSGEASHTSYVNYTA